MDEKNLKLTGRGGGIEFALNFESNIGGGLLKNLILGAALLGTASFAQIDPTILVSGNSWSYKLIVKDGPTVPRLVFEGSTFTVLDTVFWKMDTLYFSTISKDSSYVDSVTTSYEIDYAVVDGKASELKTIGNRPQHLQNGIPWFMIGSDLAGTLSYVRYDGNVRFQSRWAKSPNQTYGATTIYSYLQGIGLVSYSHTMFGSLSRGSVELNLIELNGKAFDSSKVEKLGSVTQLHRLRKKTDINAALKNVPSSHEYLINGRRANKNRYQAVFSTTTRHEH